MARKLNNRDISFVLAAADQWIQKCLIADQSVFSEGSLWTSSLIVEVYSAFVEHPDISEDDFMTKLKGQMKNTSQAAKRLMAEMLWALLLFPSNMKAGTKRQQVHVIWALSGQTLAENHPLLNDHVTCGIGSGGLGFNSYRYNELAYLIALARDLKEKNESERRHILTDYDAFFDWIEAVPCKGRRQFRHILRYFAFPDRVERISSDHDRRKILKTLGSGTAQEVDAWNDRQVDEKLADLRAHLQAQQPTAVLDFYEMPLKERWSDDQIIKTEKGDVEVTVPRDQNENEEKDATPAGAKAGQERQSIQIQAKLARIGAIMGFKVWIPQSDRGRVSALLTTTEQAALLQELPLNFDNTTIYTIEQIDVLWLKRSAIFRAFEVEQTTAVYSGLLRMADLLALQPNIDIRLHIVAPDERRDKVFTEMKRPVFSVLEGGPLYHKSSFLSYENVEKINALAHLAHTNESIIAEYEEHVE